MYKYKSITAMFCLFLLFPIVVYTQNYTNQASIISNGNGLSSGGAYDNFSILGEPIVNQSVSGGNYDTSIGILLEILGDIVGVEDYLENMSPKFMLFQNFPNPFKPVTKISYAIPKSCNVYLRIYNIKGQLVKTLINDKQKAGLHQVIWNGKDSNSNDVSNGIYLYRIDTKGFTATKKMLMLK